MNVNTVFGTIVVGLVLLGVVTVNEPDPRAVAEQQALTTAWQTDHPYLITHEGGQYFLRQEPKSWFPTCPDSLDWDVAYPSGEDADIARGMRDDYMTHMKESAE